jgi:hypothetical protein
LDLIYPVPEDGHKSGSGIHFCESPGNPRTPAPSRTLRKDAQRNRGRILDVARGLFAEQGLGVTLDDVAHHAGVVVGTV